MVVNVASGTRNRSLSFDDVNVVGSAVRAQIYSSIVRQFGGDVCNASYGIVGEARSVAIWSTCTVPLQAIFW